MEATKVKTIAEVLAAIGGAIASFFTGLPPIIWVLIAVMSIDYLTGIICGLMGKSPNTENGGVSSKMAFRGLLKKALILLVVLLAALLDKAVSMGTGDAFEAVAGATCLWFIASEGFSIIENVAAMGVPIPGVLKSALEIMRKKGEVPETPPEPLQETSPADAQHTQQLPEQLPGEQPGQEQPKPVEIQSTGDEWN